MTILERLKSAICNEENDGQLLDDAAVEIVRLMNIAQQAHDRLLRGDSDKELLAILAESWKGSNVELTGSALLRSPG